MHYYPDSVPVFPTDHRVRMPMPDGSTEDISETTGESIFAPTGQHLPKNVSGAAWDLVLVEIR